MRIGRHHGAALSLLLLWQCSAGTAGAEDGRRETGFRGLSGTYEPSGGAQLEDGRLVVVEDERERPFILLSAGDGSQPFRVEIPRPASLWSAAALALDDLEAIATGNDGFLYAITSHSRKDSGKRAAEREQIVRFKVEGSRLTDVTVAGGLREALTDAFPELEDAARERKVKRDHGLNIEGLAFDRHGRRLWIGFRGPLVDDKALVLEILNLSSVFERDEEFRFARDLIELDLDGGGVRDLAFVPRLGGLLILSQRESGKKEKKFKLWLWSGDPDAPARRVRIDGVEDLERAEAVMPIRWDGGERILLLSDDGNRARRKPAGYLLVDYSDLRIEGEPSVTRGGKS